MNFGKVGVIIQGINKGIGAFTNLWRKFNGFLLIALIVGIANFSTIFFSGGPAYHIAIDTFFSVNSIIVFFGVLYLIGVGSLLLYVGGRAFRIYTHPEQSSTTRFYLFLGIILGIFLAFDILTYIYLIVFPFSFPQMIVYGPTGMYYNPPFFEIGPGFVSTVGLTTLIIIGMISDIIYERLLLRRLYQTYLPMYAPKKQNQMRI